MTLTTDRERLSARMARERAYYLPLTDDADVQVLRAYAIEGSQKAAAFTLGLPLKTLKNRLTRAYRHLGVQNLIEAFTAMGWLDPYDSDVSRGRIATVTDFIAHPETYRGPG